MSSAANLLTSPSGELTATYLPRLGMVCSSLCHRGKELLAQRGGVDAYATHGSTFALPVLYPWANRLSGWDYHAAGQLVQLNHEDPLIHIDTARDLPIHGVLAACPDWRVTHKSDDTLVATLEYGADPARLAAFPFPHTVTYLVRLGDDGLHVGLTVVANEGCAVPISFGFHPYLTLPGSDRRQWQLTMPVSGGTLDGPLADRSFDDGFTELDAAVPEFSVADDRRRLTVRFDDGFTVAQVFAPPGSDFICFEPMTAPVDALRSGVGLRALAPRESFIAVFSILVWGINGV